MFSFLNLDSSKYDYKFSLLEIHQL